MRWPWSPAIPKVELLPQIRHGIWCDRCMRSTAVEGDVLADDKVIATLQGCPECKTGFFDESTHIDVVVEPSHIDVRLAEQAADFFTDGEAQSGQ